MVTQIASFVAPWSAPSRASRSGKRKVDVVITAGGEKALTEYQIARTARLIQVLRDLHEEDQMTLARLVEKLQALLERGAHV